MDESDDAATPNLVWVDGRLVDAGAPHPYRHRGRGDAAAAW